MIGRPVVSAIALARPVVEPPPTLTRSVDVVARGRCACPLGHLDRDVHDHVVVPQRHGEVRGDRVGQVHLGLGRDQHDPGGAEAGDLAAQIGRRFAGTEGDALRQGVVDEAHGLTLPPAEQGGEGVPE